MRKTILAVTLVALLPACATIDGGGLRGEPPAGSVFSGADAGNGLRSGDTIQFNGITLRALSKADAAAVGMSNARIRSVSDIRAADRMIANYRDLAWDSFAKGDYASFDVYRHLGRRVLADRAVQVLATRRVLASARAGSAELPAQTAVFLPDRLYEAGAKVGLSSPFPVLNWSEGVQVAALGQLAGGLLGGTAADPNGLKDLPVGTVFAVGDGARRYMVERRTDGFLFYNPGRQPVSVALEQLGYMPIVNRPASWRASAAPIAANVKSALRAMARESYAAGDKNSPVRAVPPASVVSGRMSWRLDASGAVTSPQSRSGIEAYRSNRAYKFAVDLYGSSGTGRAAAAAALTEQCRAYGQDKRADVFIDTEYLGPNLERMRVICAIAPSMAPVFAREYLVLDDMSAQSYDSVVADQRVVRRIDEVNAEERLAEAITAFIPILSNVDAGARCLDQKTVTARAYGLVRSAPERDLSVFVSDLLYRPEDPSALERGLDCTLGLAVPGIAGRAAGQLASGYVSYARTEQARDVAAALRLFDQHTFSVSGWGDVAATLSRSTNPKTVLAAKLFYEGAQTTQDFTELSAAVAQSRQVGRN